MRSNSISPHLSACLDTAESLLGQSVQLEARISGGDVADAYRLVCKDGMTVFMKTHRNPPPGFFLTEATGLGWLRDSGTVAIPAVLGVCDSPPLLLLEWIDTGRSTDSTETDLGISLAALHRIKQTGFGRPDGRTTGSLGLPNAQLESWTEFIATQRLLPLARIARNRKALPEKGVRDLERLASRIDQLDIPVPSPSLLHGDLWAGNRLVDSTGRSWLIDPAVFHGHREFDLAMMRLFGGYSEACFSAYHESYPLEPEWEARIALHQISPLTVHAIKFGGSYVGATLDALIRYI